jgi:hypothetical protein
MEGSRADYPEEQYDALLVFSGRDRNDAVAFRDFLCCISTPSEDRNFPKIRLLDSADRVDNDLTRMELLADSCTLILLWITDNFIEDHFCEFIKNELIMQNLECQAHKIIPVYPRQPVKRVPLGLRSINGLSLSRVMTRSNVAESLAIVTNENIDRMDLFLGENIKKLFEDNLRYRLRRELAEVEKLEIVLRKKADLRRQQAGT